MSLPSSGTLAEWLREFGVYPGEHERRLGLADRVLDFARNQDVEHFSRETLQRIWDEADVLGLNSPAAFLGAKLAKDQWIAYVEDLAARTQRSRAQQIAQAARERERAEQQRRAADERAGETREVDELVRLLILEEGIAQDEAVLRARAMHDRGETPGRYWQARARAKLCEFFETAARNAAERSRAAAAAELWGGRGLTLARAMELHRSDPKWFFQQYLGKPGAGSLPKKKKPQA